MKESIVGYGTMSQRLSSARGALRPIRALMREQQRMVVPKNFLDEYIVCKHLSYLIKDRDIDLVIDVGANRGQFGRMIRKYCSYGGRMMSFEPQPDIFSLLDRSASKDANWTVFNIALGKEDASLSLNVMRSSVFSSFLHPKDGLMEELNSVVRAIEVPVRRLDAIVKESKCPSPRILLKTDTQGFDLEVIQGATGIIDEVEAIIVEVSVIPIYENSPDYLTTINRLGSLGFVLSGMYPVTLSRGKAVEFDCIMVKDRKSDSHDAVSYGSMLRKVHL